MTLVMDEIEKGHTHMQEIMRIGDEFVVADDDIKDIGHTSTEITDVAKKYNTDVLAVVSKGEHNITTQCHNEDVKFEENMLRLVALILAFADTYKVDAVKVVELIKILVEEGGPDE